MTRLPLRLLDAAAGAVMHDGSCVEHEAARLLADLALDPEQPDPLPPLREIEEAIAEAVAAIREGISERRCLEAEWAASRGIRFGGR